MALAADSKACYHKTLKNEGVRSTAKGIRALVKDGVQHFANA